MKIATKTRNPEQARLFDDRLQCVEACRNWVGDYYEEATKQLFGGHRVATHGGVDYCPDITLAPGLHLEVKAVGKGNAAIAYDSRLAKDDAFVRQGNRLYYVLWHHTFNIPPEGIVLPKLRSGLAAVTASVLILSAEEFSRTLRAGPLMKLNSSPRAKGYGSPQYRMGYRTRLGLFTGRREAVRHTEPLRVYETTLQGFDVYGGIDGL